MDIYKKNMNLLKQYKKSLYEVIKNEESLFPIDIKVEDDEFIASRGDIKIHLHSRYNIYNEMIEMFKGIDTRAKTIVIFGVGVGYPIYYIMENLPNVERLVIIEPSGKAIKLMLEHVLLEEVIKKIGTIDILVARELEDVGEFIHLLMESDPNLQIVDSITFNILYPEYLNRCNYMVRASIEMVLSNARAYSDSAYFWLTNTIRNFSHYHYHIEDFIDIFKNRTIILVGAGPSLNKNINYLKEVKDKAIIIAGGSAITVLNNNGIEPHFRMAFDGLPREMRMLENIDTEHIPLIFGAILYYEILQNYKGPKIFMQTKDAGISEYILRKSNVAKNLYPSYASIIGIANNLVVASGAKKVIFVGQDMSSTKESYYAKGSNLTNEIPDEMIPTLDIYGNEVYTNAAMLDTKYLLEKFIRINPQCEFINATEGGLGIDKAENKMLIDVINELSYKDDQNIRQLIQKRIDSKKINEQLTIYESSKYFAIRDIEMEAKLLKNELDEILRNIQKIKKSINSRLKLNKIINLITKVESQYKETLSHKLMQTIYYLFRTRFSQMDFSIRSMEGNSYEKLLKKTNIISEKVVELREYLIKMEEELKGYVDYKKQHGFDNITQIKNHMKTFKKRNELLILGDSTMIYNNDLGKKTSETQPMKDILVNKLSPDYDVEVDSGSAYLPAYYYGIVKLMEVNKTFPKKVLLPINLRSFSPSWEINPKYSHWQIISVIKEFLDQEYNEQVDFYNCDKLVDWVDFLNLDKKFYLTTITKIREFEKVLESRPKSKEDKQIKMSLIYIYHYLYDLTHEHRQLKLLINSINMLTKNNVEVIPYIVPINYEACCKYLGDNFVNCVSKNIEVIRREVKQKCNGLDIIDYSKRLEAKFFPHFDEYTEHLNYEGRLCFSDILVNLINGGRKEDESR